MQEFSSSPLILISAVFLAVLAGSFAAARIRLVLSRIIRVGMAVLLLLVVLRPSVSDRNASANPVIAVMMDNSNSMVLTKKLREAVKYFRQIENDLKKNFELKYYFFSSDASPVKSFSPDSSGGRSTDISRSLWTVRRENGAGLAGILLFTDGNHNGQQPPGRWVSDLNVPVTVVSLSQPSSVRDVGVIGVNSADFAFKNTPLTVSVAVRLTGCASVPVKLSVRSKNDKSRIIAAKTITADKQSELVSVDMQFTPEAGGRFTYLAMAEPVEGEATSANNSAEFVLDVIRDKTRALYICGRPGPEYAFLRNVLKNDANVELVSFVILRRPENIALVPEHDLALIPFPVHELFTKELFNFDILILDNFSYRGFGFRDEYFSNIAKWVRERGGGLLIKGGEDAFANGGWNSTALADIIPVEMSDSGADSMIYESYKPMVADYSHPVMLLDDNPKKNRQLWENLPALEGCRVLKAKSQASALAFCPWRELPLITAWQYKKGRVAAIASDTTWRWALQAPTPREYNKFWTNVIRYLSSDENVSGYKVLLDKSRYFAGQEFNAKIYSPGQSRPAELRLSLTEPSGPQRFLEIKTGTNMLFTAGAKLDKAGLYKISLYSANSSKPLWSGVLQAGEASILEDSNLGNNETMLKYIAEVSGGALLNQKNASAGMLSDKFRKGGRSETRKKKELFKSPLWMFVITAFFVFDLLFRRKKGLL